MTQEVVLPDTTEVLAHRVLESENGFLVVGEMNKEATEVARNESGFECECFFSKVSADSDCEHVRAVKQYLQQLRAGDEFHIMSQADADNFLSKVASLDEQQECNQTSMDTQIAKVQLWMEAETEKINRQKEYYLFALESYMLALDRPTQKLVNGVLKLRAQQPEIIIHDELAVLADSRFTRTIPEKQTVDKRILRKHLISTGEEIDGTEVVMRPAKFSYYLHQGIRS
jgi:hypothetical protein